MNTRIENKQRRIEEPLDPWSVEDWAFPHSGTDSEKLRFLLNYAVLAPSGHNTQPWRFRIVEGEASLYADPTRALAVVDPGDRELIMSCGAALFHLRVAMRHFGYRPVVYMLPGATEADLLATVRLGPKMAVSEGPTMEDQRLFRAIKRRRTNRMPFAETAVSESVLALLQEAARAEGARLFVVGDPEERNALADLIAAGDRLQNADAPFRRELAAWVHPNRSRSRDGLPGYAHGVGDLLSYLGPFVVRTFDRGEGQAAKDRQLAEGSPVLLVLDTEADDVRAHLAAGQALDRVLLTATAYRLSASFLNQPVEVRALRSKVAELVGGRYPQVVLRMGYGRAVRATPRRPVRAVLDQHAHHPAADAPARVAPTDPGQPPGASGCR